MAKRSLAGLLVLLFLAIAGAFAPARADDDRQATINRWNNSLDLVAQSLKNPSLQENSLADLKANAQSVDDQATALVHSLAPEIAAINQQIQQLAPPTDTQTPEAPAVTAARKQQQDALDAVATISKQAEVARLRAEDLVRAVADRQSARFISSLFAHDVSLLSPTLWQEAAGQLPGAVADFGRAIADWLLSIESRSDRLALLLGAGAILILLAAFWVARRLMGGIGNRLAESAPGEARRIFAATALVVIDVAAPLLVVFSVRGVLAALDFLPDPIDRIFTGLVGAVVAFSLLHGLARAILAPSRPKWRFARVDDERAAQLYNLVSAIATVLALNPLLRTLSAVSDRASRFATAAETLIFVVVAVLVFLLGRAASAPPSSDKQAAARAAGAHGVARFLWHWGMLAAMVGAAIALLAALSGYLVFANFLVRQMIWTGVVVALTTLVSNFIDQGILILTGGHGQAKRWLATGLGVQSRALTQGGIVVNGVIQLLVFAMAALVIAAPWGVDSSGLTSAARTIAFGFKIGSVTLTLSSVLAALAVFLAGMVLTRTVQRWLDDRLLPTTDLNAGLRNSIRTIVGYAGFVIAVALAGIYAGIDLSSIAIIAGALSVGIGFGLQSIVNNFVSGLILLAERPIRVGDWIAVGTDEGTVKRISVRATELETFDRASVIVPNSNLIAGVVKNRYLRDNSARIAVSVGVSYASDPEKVRDLLLACAREHALVLSAPPPQVFFMDFGASALTFELRCDLADASNGLTVRSDLRFAIIKALRAADIEIPFDQRDINLRDWPRIEGVLMELSGKKRADSEDKTA